MLPVGNPIRSHQGQNGRSVRRDWEQTAAIIGRFFAAKADDLK
jgi:hypothetical protein